MLNGLGDACLLVSMWHDPFLTGSQLLYDFVDPFIVKKLLHPPPKTAQKEGWV